MTGKPDGFFAKTLLSQKHRWNQSQYFTITGKGEGKACGLGIKYYQLEENSEIVLLFGNFYNVGLIFSTILANSANDKIMLFAIYFFIFILFFFYFIFFFFWKTDFNNLKKKCYLAWTAKAYFPGK